MIDIFTVELGDRVEYGPHLSTAQAKVRYGTYKDFMIWSPDIQTPVEMWLELTREDNGLPTMIRASQVLNVYRASKTPEVDDYEF